MYDGYILKLFRNISDKKHLYMAELYLLLVLLASQCVTVSPGAVSPATITVDGNTANSNSDITWSSIPAGDPYSDPATYEDGGLKPLFDLSRSFINTVLPGEIPYSIIRGLIDGTFDIAQQYMELISQSFLGIVVCVVLAILWIFLMPIVGCCFCCCRLCGNCGGKMEQKKDERAGCKRMVFGVILFLCIIFMITGSVCIYVTNEQIPTAVTKVGTTITDTGKDADTFLANTVLQIKHVAVDGFNFTKKVVLRDLDNVDVLVGEPVRDNLRINGNISTTLDSIRNLDASIYTVSQAMLALNESYNYFVGNLSELTYQVAAATGHLNSALANCPATPAPNCGIDSSGYATGYIATDLPSLTSQMALLDQVKANNLTVLANQGAAMFDDLPTVVKNQSQATVDALKGTLDSLDGTIASQIDSITGMLGGISVQNMTSVVTGFTEEYLNYDQYRRYAGIGLSSIVLLIVLLLLLGLVLGCFGSSVDDIPTQRGSAGTCGGNCLMAAVGFMFIFASLLMLLCMILFIIGAPLEKYICQPLTDPTFKIYKELLDGPTGSLLGDGYALGNLLFQNSTINLTISGVLQGCKDNKAIYEVMMIDRIFDISSLLDYRSMLNVDVQLNALNVDLTSIQILTPETEAQLNNFRDSLNINFTAFTSQLSLNLATIDFTNVSAQINASADGLVAANSSTNVTDPLYASGAEFMGLEVNYLPPTVASKNQLLTDLSNLETAIGSIASRVNDSIDAIKVSENYLHTNGSGVITNELTNYANRLLGVADSFASNALNSLKTDIGRCQIIWNVYHTVTSIILCSYVVDILNGFWISIGWCLFFFIPSMVFAVKLAKHFRKMKTVKGYSTDDIEMQKQGSYISLRSNNKIGHSDDAK